MAISPEEAQFFLNHLFLPPKLPDQSDHDHAAKKLLTLFATIAHKYGDSLDPAERLEWLPIANSISIWRDVYSPGTLCEKVIEERLKSMDYQATLLVFLEAQNTAVLVTRLEDVYKFEAWEVTAKQESVLAAKNCLAREYPAVAIEIPIETVRASDFLHTLPMQLADLTTDTYVPESMEMVKKAGSEIEESRQSRNPSLVTAWLFAALASYGRPSKTKAVQKRTRDEVNWNQALLPWRRSPVWSCMKVALQLTIRNSLLLDTDQQHYKHFMVYFLSYMAYRMLSDCHSMDHLQVMRTKIARRASKLEGSVPAFVASSYTSTVEHITHKMQRQWEQAKVSECSHLPFVSIGNYDSAIYLPTIHSFLQSIGRQPAAKSTRHLTSSDPECSTAFSLSPHELPDPSIFEFGLAPETAIGPETIRKTMEVLIVFESWVANNLSVWLSAASLSENVCSRLRILIEKFWSASVSYFSPYAESMSIALLTVFELWVALDKLTVILYPLVEEYSPGFPASIFSPLLLRKYNDMVRLQAVESYLRGRDARSIYESIFKPLSRSSLTVRLFDQSRSLQLLMRDLDAEAERQKEYTRMEFERLRKVYDNLKERLRDQECDVVWIKDGPDAGKSEHSEACKRCRLQSQARRMSIARYEEILPEDASMRKAVVYELRPDPAIVVYRDCLWFMLKDIMGFAPSKLDVPFYGLKDADTIASFAPSLGRLSLASITKPHGKTHRHSIRITTSVETLFYPHAMVWEMIAVGPPVQGTADRRVADNLRNHKGHTRPLLDRNANLSLSHLVRAQLGTSPYSELIDTVHSTYVSQNSVIARQSSCPAEVHVSEWVAFGSMRSGSHLQLINLLRSLCDGQTDCSAPATVILVEQMLHEAGDAKTRTNQVVHVVDTDFRQSSFVRQIVYIVSKTLKAIANNWKETNRMWVLLTVIQRTLSMVKDADSETASECISLIRVARRISRRWLDRLIHLYNTQRAEGATTASSNETRLRILHTALLTRAT